MSRRGLTVLEILIAVAILGAIAAVVLPPVASRIGDRNFDAAVRRIGLAAELCRSRAIRSGEARVLVARETDETWTLHAEPLKDAVSPEDAEVPPRSFRPLSELPRGCSVSDDPPTEDIESVFETEVPAIGPPLDIETEPTSPDAEPANEHRLAAYLPDGRALPVSEHHLIGRAGRSGVIRISAITGLARVIETVPDSDQTTQLLMPEPAR